jgi:hypothetical protein
MFEVESIKVPIFGEGYVDTRGRYNVAGVYVIGVGDLKQWGVWTRGNRLHSEHDTEDEARTEAERLNGDILDRGEA